jgi:putative membrane protein
MRRIWPCLVLLVCILGDADAHGTAAEVPRFTFDPLVTVPLFASLLMFLAGVVRLWNRGGPGSGIRHWQVRCFTAGWAMLVLALVTPLHWLGERLFAAHMVEHELLMIGAAPLLVIARPFPAFVWGLPKLWRPCVGLFLKAVAGTWPWRAVMDARVATAIHGIAIWVWHLPQAFASALASPWVHWLQHMSFLFSAILFWWALLRDRRREGVAVMMLFITALHSGMLGILLTLARRPLYPAQPTAGGWGMTALEDQQAAGLLMWIPPGVIYLGAALALLALWMRRASVHMEVST